MEDYEEKGPATYAGTPTESDDGITSAAVTWTAEEENRLVRKIDFIIMPCLILGFWGLQLDRGNIGNALTNNFLKDVGITQDQFNVGQQLLSVGIVLLEIPSNFVLYRLGPRAWISGQIFVWGLIALFQAFQHGYGAFLATRLLLGLGESGFIPASLYCITTFYKRNETSKRFSWFFLGNMIALATSGEIAYGILQMKGVCGLKGWQWLFIIEGLLTIIISFIFMAFFPHSPGRPVPFLGIKYFNERETQMITLRVLADDPSKARKGSNITRAELKAALSDWSAYPHLLLTICAIAPATTLGSYAPSLIASWGYGALRSNALYSVGAWCQVVLDICWGFGADRTHNRGYWTLGGLLLWWGWCIGNLGVSTSSNKHAKYAFIVLAVSAQNIWHPINGSWLALNARSPGERSVKMAMLIMSANAAGIMGSQLFRASDKPHYHTGWTVIVCLLSVAVAACIFANVQYRVLNRNGAVRSGTTGQVEDAEIHGEVEKIKYQL